MSDLLASILGAVAEEEVRRLGLRVRQAWAEVARKGWYKCSASIPWGYVSRPSTDGERKAGAPQTALDVDSLSAGYVTEIFARAVRGEPTRAIARWSRTLPSDVRGVRYSDNAEKATRRGRRVRDEVRQCSQRFVQAMLRNSVYVGRTSDGTAGQWPALVTEDVWNTVQKRLDDNCAAPHADRSSFLLTGILRCPVCQDRPMHGQTFSRGVKRYRCSGATQTLCSQTADTLQIDAQVKDEIARMLLRLAQVDPERLRAEYARLERPSVGLDHTREVKRLEAAVAVHTKCIADSARLLVNGTLDKVGYQALVGAEQSALAAAEAELARLTRLQVVADPENGRIDDVLAVDWQRVVSEGSPEMVRDVIALLVAGIRPVRVKRGTYAVEMGWTKLAQRLLDASSTLTTVKRVA